MVCIDSIYYDNYYYFLNLYRRDESLLNVFMTLYNYCCYCYDYDYYYFFGILNLTVMLSIMLLYLKDQHKQKLLLKTEKNLIH